jgi:hypothetical protein
VALVSEELAHRVLERNVGGRCYEF